MCGAFFFVTLVWYFLYWLQSGPEREGRFGGDGKFFIQWDDKDVQQYWKEHPNALPEGVRRRRGLEAPASSVVDVELVSDEKEPIDKTLKPASDLVKPPSDHIDAAE